jgi:Co/Zn/Cd efflux system component
MYAEHVKETEGKISVSKQLLLDIYIPSATVCGLLAITTYVIVDAIDVLLHPTADDAVDVYFLYGFASANFVVDVLCMSLFAARGSGALLEEKAVPDPITAVHQPSDLRKSGSIDNGHAEDVDSESGQVQGVPSVRSGEYTEVVGNNTNHVDADIDDDASKEELEATIILSKNINMMTALTHVSGDTVRTASVFASAVVATVTDVQTSVCDAWAAVVVSCTILGIVVPLLREIIISAKTHYRTSSTSSPEKQ